MKIVVTGHTRGIGKAIYDLLSSYGHEVVGMSRSNGFDLSEFEKVASAVLEEDPGILINNAFAPQAQTNLLKTVYASWREKHKFIINMGSVAALIPKNHPDYCMPYASDKREQKEFCDVENFNYSKTEFLNIKCRLTNLNFDYVSTDFPSKHDKRGFPNLRARQVAKVVDMLVSDFCMGSTLSFRELTFHSTAPPEIKK